MIVHGGQVRLSQRNRHPAQAGAHDVHVRRAGDLADHVDGVDRGLHVGVEVPVALLLGRVAPAHSVHLDPLLEQVLVHAAARREVKRVVLVHLRRHHQHRALVDRLGLRRVLDQLEHLVAVDDRAGGGRQVLADGERLAVDHRRHPVVVPQVADPVGQPAADAAAAGVVQALDGRGVSGEEVGRRQGLPEQDRPEAQPLDALAGQAQVVEIALHRGAPGEVALHGRPEQGVLLPGRVGEALVALLRRDLRPAETDLDHFLAEVGHGPRNRLRVARGRPGQETQAAGRLAEAEDLGRAELPGGGRLGLGLRLGLAPSPWPVPWRGSWRARRGGGTWFPFWVALVVLVSGVPPRGVVMTASL